MPKVPNISNCKYDEIYNRIISCEVLDASVNQGNFAPIKYISSKFNISHTDFLYDNLPLMHLLVRANRFKDLDGMKFLISKHNKTYPEGIYEDISRLTTKMQLARSLNDLEGLKYSYKAHNKTYLEFYNASYFDNEFKKFEFAVRLQDDEELKNLHKNLTEEIDFLSLLKQAFYQCDIDTAQQIISSNLSRINETVINEVVKNFARPNFLLCSNNIKNSIFNSFTILGNNNLNVNAKLLVETLESLYNTMNSKHHSSLSFLYRKPIYSDLDKPFKYLDIFNYSYLKTLHEKIQDIIKIIAIHSIKHSNLGILIPSFGIDEFYNESDVDDPYKDHFIYITLGKINQNSFELRLIKTLSKAFFELLFDYYGNQMLGYISYQNILKETISKVNQYEYLGDDYAFIEVEEATFDYLVVVDSEKYMDFSAKIIEWLRRELIDEAPINQLFDPFIKYWDNAIYPVIENIKEQHFKECKDYFLETQNFDNCILGALTEIQQKELYEECNVLLNGQCKQMFDEQLRSEVS